MCPFCLQPLRHPPHHPHARLLCSGRQHQPLTLWEAAALTSASQSFIRFWKAGTRSVLVISGPTAFWSYRKGRKGGGSERACWVPSANENKIKVQGTWTEATTALGVTAEM